MAPKKTETTALATRDEERELAAMSELTDFFDALAVTGMEDVGGEDVKLAVKLFNMSGVDANRKPRQKNTFFDNITEEVVEEIECVFLLTQKTHRYDVFDNAKKETEVICQSSDRITGTMKDGTQRDCNGCPDRGWFRGEDGRPTRRCGEVHNVVAIDRLTQKPFVVRFKKTSLKPWRNYLMQHHFGARVTKTGARADVPLFAFESTIGLEMVEEGTHAVPVFKRGPVLSPESIRAMADNAKSYLEMMQDVLNVADKADAKHAEAQTTGDDFAE